VASIANIYVILAVPVSSQAFGQDLLKCSTVARLHSHHGRVSEFLPLAGFSADFFQSTTRDTRGASFAYLTQSEAKL
jgi:hypothetical protein